MAVRPVTAPSGLIETRLLFDALRPGTTAQAWQEACAAADADPDRLAVRALVLGLAPMLHHRLAEIGSALPERADAKLAAAREAHGQRNRSILDQYGEIIEALEREGVRPIALKGVHLAALVYPEVGLRPMNDIDLLVEPHEMAAAAGVLASLGYAARDTSPRHGAGVTKHTTTFRRSGGAPTTPNPYLSTSGDRTVEPHTSLEESWLGLRVDITPGVRSRAVEHRLGGCSCRVLAPEDLLLHLAVHLMFHLIIGHPAMVQLVDLATVSGSVEVDWDAVARRATERRAAPFALAALGLARGTLDAPIPESLLVDLRRQTPPALRRRAAAMDLSHVLRRTQQPPVRSLTTRVRHGLADRVAAARWARDWQDRWQITRTVLEWWRSDTARVMMRRGKSR